MAAAYYEDDDDYHFVIAASSEEEDDDYIKVITTFAPPPTSLPSSSSSHVFAAASASWPLAPYVVDAEEEIVVPAPFVDSEGQIVPSSPPAATHCNNDVDDAAMMWEQDDDVHDPTHPLVLRFHHRRMDVVDNLDEYADGGGGEVTDAEEDEDDYRYQGYYDLADRGRARHVKRSSGRRGRTKKASTMGRPRGDVRHAHCSVNL